MLCRGRQSFARQEPLTPEDGAELIYPLGIALRRLAHENEQPLSVAVRTACTYIATHLADDIDTDDIARAANLSRVYFCRLFLREMGMTPHHYLLKLRLERACMLLRSPEWSIQEISELCGFASPNYVSTTFRHAYHTPPSQFRDEVLRALNSSEQQAPTQRL